MAVQCETSEKGSDANINVETVAPCNTKSKIHVKIFFCINNKHGILILRYKMV